MDIRSRVTGHRDFCVTISQREHESFFDICRKFAPSSITMFMAMNVLGPSLLLRFYTGDGKFRVPGSHSDGGSPLRYYRYCVSVAKTMRNDCYRALCSAWCCRFSIEKLLLCLGVPCLTSDT